MTRCRHNPPCQRREYWGRGGAGVLFTCSEDGTVLLLLRAAWVEQGGTWGIPGGGIGEGFFRTPMQPITDLDVFRRKAQQEAEEECGGLPPGMARVPEGLPYTQYEDCGFRYTTFILDIPKAQKDAWRPYSADGENDAFVWFPLDKVKARRPLPDEYGSLHDIHFGVNFTMDNLPTRANPRRRVAPRSRVRKSRSVSLAERGARLTAELRRRPHRVVRRRNPDGSKPDPAAGLSDEMRWLWSSLHFDTPQQRAEELAYQARWYLQQVLDEDGDFDDLVERMEDDEETDEIIEAINERDPNWLVRWHDDAGPEMMQNNASETPSFMFFDDPKVVKDGWWVHFTNDARDIERSGFAYGESDPMQLGLTTWKSKEAKRGPGYVFAFDPRYAVERNFGGWAHSTTGKYGREAVVFRADAVTAYHHGDEEDQAISWGPEAKDIHAVYFDGEHAPGLSGNRPPRNGVAGTYDDYEDVTFFADLPTLIRYIKAGKNTNPLTHRSRR